MVGRENLAVLATTQHSLKATEAACARSYEALKRARRFLPPKSWNALQARLAAMKKKIEADNGDPASV